MPKTIKVILIILLFTLGIVVGCIAFYKYYSSSPKRMAEFIGENKSKCSVTIIKNDSTIFELNPDSKRALASAMKTIVMIEYASQVSLNKLSDGEAINLDEIGVYYVKNTDGGAHQKWLDDMREQSRIINNTAQLSDVAKGMILYSSNACTEYMMDKLGLDNINNSLVELNLKQHDKLFYIVSYLYLMQTDGYEKVKEMTNEQVVAATKEIHQKIKARTISYDAEKDISEQEEILLSQKFTKSTTREYTDLMGKLFSHKYFNDKFRACMDAAYAAFAKKNKFQHFYIKGGSTLTIITNAYYIKTQEGDEYKVAYFLNDLDIKDFFLMKSSVNNFDLSIIGRKEGFDDLLKTMKK